MPDGPLPGTADDRRGESGLTFWEAEALLQELAGASIPVRRSPFSRLVARHAQDLRPHDAALAVAERPPEAARRLPELGGECTREHRGVGESAGNGDILDLALLVEQEIARRLQPDPEVELRRRLVELAQAVALERTQQA